MCQGIRLGHQVTFLTGRDGVWQNGATQEVNDWHGRVLAALTLRVRAAGQFAQVRHTVVMVLHTYANGGRCGHGAGTNGFTSGFTSGL